MSNTILQLPKLTIDQIKTVIAHSEVIFTRGEKIYSLGNYSTNDETDSEDILTYTIDGNYGEYTVTIKSNESDLHTSCTCPFPYGGCKHIVAACLDLFHKQRRNKQIIPDQKIPEELLTPEEIKEIAVNGRKEKAKKTGFVFSPGETYKGEHVVRNPKGKEYIVNIYNPEKESGHCTCPDFACNNLETCKHLMFALEKIKEDKQCKQQSGKEVFPYVHLSWSSRLQKPFCFFELKLENELKEQLDSLFSDIGIYKKTSLTALYNFYLQYGNISLLRFDLQLLSKLEDELIARELSSIKKKYKEDYSFLNAELYPYQKEGVDFAIFRRSCIIADEMGLGKTIQAIGSAIAKKNLFGFNKVLVICPSSVKEQWKKEIDKFSEESAVIVEGGRAKRHQIYEKSRDLFKITNYEAVLRDVTIIKQWEPDFIILDEAQRIKNFETKTHQAVLSLPRKHSLVITGTPLENKLEDLYSIVQFSDPELLTPLWIFAGTYMQLDNKGQHSIMGYKNLDLLRDKLKDIVIRRKKEEVFDCLPEVMENTFYLDMSMEQEEIHQGFIASLLAVLSKKILTPMDIKRMQEILLCMRMSADSTYLIDKKTNISPKLVELVSILKDLVINNKRKVIIFSEWTTMTYLIGKAISNLGIDFVEFSGKVPVKKRQVLIDEFQSNPDCMIFLSTDAGGTGLNLQNADCVINFDLPWNPAKLNQRIGRVNRIGQQSTKVNVINMVSKHSIEEKVLAGIHLKQELFDGVFDAAADSVDFSQEAKTKFVNKIRLLFDEELEMPKTEKSVSADLDEKTPHFLNPQVFAKDETKIDLSGEEISDDMDDTENPVDEERMKSEEVESVLTQGLEFLNSLAKMATGKNIVSADSGKKAIEIDKETGEVVMRFKLPGY